MARRKKGRSISGWLIVDKPAGWSSAAVVNKVKWAFEAQKAGHAGTLDPDATGLLAIALGEATKTVPYLTDALKAYDFAVNWGAATNTDDLEGEVIATRDARPSEADVIAALPAFTGEIMQVPPAFSAVKIDGERAYKAARKGEGVALKARPLFVDTLRLDAHTQDQSRLHMVCGKGGYVRAIGRDLGETLGCLGHIAWLRRVWSGPFTLEDAVSLDDIETRARTPEIDELLLPIETALADLPRMTATEAGALRLTNGNPGEVIGDAEPGEMVWAARDGAPIAIGRYMGGMLHPDRVFRVEV
ncbi:tRNA pseudouridine(55) synthase TruB [Paracoccaceae bacterium GXU_MW_L88]